MSDDTPAEKLCTIKIRFESDPKYLDIVYNLAKEVGAFTKRLSEKDIFRFCIATSEAVTNAIIHGNKSKKDKNVDVEFYVEEAKLVMTVADEGDGSFEYAPDKHSILDVDDLLAERGRGIYLMGEYSDDLRYEKTKNNGTKLILTIKYKEETK